MTQSFSKPIEYIQEERDNEELGFHYEANIDITSDKLKLFRLPNIETKGGRPQDLNQDNELAKLSSRSSKARTSIRMLDYSKVSN